MTSSSARAQQALDRADTPEVARSASYLGERSGRGRALDALKGHSLSGSPGRNAPQATSGYASLIFEAASMRSRILSSRIIPMSISRFFGSRYSALTLATFFPLCSASST